MGPSAVGEKGRGLLQLRKNNSLLKTRPQAQDQSLGERKGKGGDGSLCALSCRSQEVCPSPSLEGGRPTTTIRRDDHRPFISHFFLPLLPSSPPSDPCRLFSPFLFSDAELVRSLVLTAPAFADKNKNKNKRKRR